MSTSEPERGTASPLARIFAGLGALRVPQRGSSIWYSFGWLTLFLLAVMVGTGMLLSIYYEPSAAPAMSIDGKPMLTVQVRAGAKLDRYAPGSIIAVPYDPATGELLVTPHMQQSVDVIENVYTGKPIRPSGAWVSVENRIMREVTFGSMIRTVHAYAAGMLFASLFLHLFSALLMRAYRARRGAIWATGLLLLLLVTASGFTGSVLPWSTLSFSAARVAVGYPEQSIPLAGPMLADIIRGGGAVAGTTLTRIFSLHAILLPFLILIVVALHLLLVHAVGLAGPAASKERSEERTTVALAAGSALLLILIPIVTGTFAPTDPLVVVPLVILPVAVARLLSTMVAGSLHDLDASSGAAPTPRARPDSLPFYGTQLRREMVGWTLLLGILGTMAAAAPRMLEGEAGLPVDITQPILTPRNAHPEWYLMIPYQLLRVLPGSVAMAAIAILLVLLFALPRIDRGEARARSMAIGLFLIVLAAGLTLWGYWTAT
jgi:quinol-cytochrome oxidoreductase complex cytochrome b subunit